MIEQKLMRNLMRASASVRRHPRPEEGHRHHKGRGYGHILDLLADGEGISQQQIADALGIRPQSVSEAVAIMEDQGFVRKEANKNDRRITLVYITEQGGIRREELAQERAQRAKRLFSVLSESEKEQLLQLLEKINLSAEHDKEVDS